MVRSLIYRHIRKRNKRMLHSEGEFSNLHTSSASIVCRWAKRDFIHTARHLHGISSNSIAIPLSLIYTSQYYSLSITILSQESLKSRMVIPRCLGNLSCSSYIADKREITYAIARSSWSPNDPLLFHNYLLLHCDMG